MVYTDLAFPTRRRQTATAAGAGPRAAGSRPGRRRATDERVDDHGVELLSAPAWIWSIASSTSSATAYGRVGRHGVPRVGDRDDRRLERDVLAAQAIGIAEAVPALVVVADGGNGVLERGDPRHDLGPAVHVLPHDRRLGAVERARLREDRVGHPDLPDVVEEGRRRERSELLGRKAELAADRERDAAYALRVTGRVRVAGLDRRVQRLDRLEQRRLELARGLEEVVRPLRQGLVLRLQSHGRAARRVRRAPSQSTAKTMTTATQIVRSESATVSVTSESLERELRDADRARPGRRAAEPRRGRTSARHPAGSRPRRSARRARRAFFRSALARCRPTDRPRSTSRSGGRPRASRGRCRCTSVLRLTVRRRSRRVRGVTTIAVAADDARREGSVDVRRCVAGVVLERGGAQIGRRASRRGRRRRRRG